MTPGDLYKQYRNLYVELLDGRLIFHIDVHEYRNHDLKGDFSTAAGYKEYTELKAKIEKDCKKVGTNKYQFNYEKASGPGLWAYPRALMITTWPDLTRPFVGKGTPDDIRTALRLAVHYEMLKPTASAIQEYCDRNIGIDCAGFAAAYYRGKWVETPYDVGDFQRESTKLSRLEDVRDGDAIIWRSGAHIAVIDKIAEVGREAGKVDYLVCNVAESTGERMLTDGPSDGLNYTTYALYAEQRQGHFKAVRSLVQRQKDAFYDVRVYLCRLT